MTKELTPLEVSKQLKDFVLEVVKNGLDRMFIDGSFDIIDKTLKDYEDLAEYIDTLQGDRDYWCNIATRNEKKLEALEIIRNILKHTSHFRLGERRIGKDKTSYYLIISCGAGECEYKLKNKEEYDTLKEIL